MSVVYNQKFETILSAGDTVIGHVSDALKVYINGSVPIPVFVSPAPGGGFGQVFTQGTATALAGGGTATLLTYTVPAGKTIVLQRVRVEAQNASTFRVKINAVDLEVKSIGTAGPFSSQLDYFTSDGYGPTYPAGTVVSINVTNNRATPANFQAVFQALEY